MAREGTVRNTFHGMAFGPGSVSVAVRIDWAGRPGSVCYNKMNGKGDVSMPLPGDSDYDVAMGLYRKAHAQAEAARCYFIDNMRDHAAPWLRHAVYVHEGPYGHSVYFDEEPNCQSTLQGYGLDDDERAQIIASGVPFVDTRGVSQDRLLVTISFPMASERFNERDVDPGIDRGSLSRCSLHFACKLYEAIGARVYNIPAETIPGERLANNKRHNELFTAYVRGDEQRLGQLMFDF